MGTPSPAPLVWRLGRRLSVCSSLESLISSHGHPEMTGEIRRRNGRKASLGNEPDGFCENKSLGPYKGI